MKRFFHYVIRDGAKFYLGQTYFGGFETLTDDINDASTFNTDDAFDISNWVGGFDSRGTEVVE